MMGMSVVHQVVGMRHVHRAKVIRWQNIPQPFSFEDSLSSGLLPIHAIFGCLLFLFMRSLIPFLSVTCSLFKAYPGSLVVIVVVVPYLPTHVLDGMR